ncbi:hypothetical protein B566_EDAN010012, partial [Ephemera danica]
MPKTRGRFSKSVRSDYRLLRQVNEVQPRLLRAISGDLQNEERRITRSQATTFLGSDDAASQVANDLDELGEGDNDGAEQAQDQNNPDDTQDGVPSDSDTSSFSDGEFYGDSDSDWEEVDEPEEGINSEPLYPHSKINLLESCIMILSFVIRFKLPLASIKSLLQLIKCHMPEQSKLATSLYHIRKLLLFNNYKPLKNFYCGGCDKNLSEHENCFRRRCRGKKVHSFFTFDIEKQLKVLFARDTFRNAIMHRFNRTKVVDSNYEDIYDGDLYQRFANYFNDPYNFSMMFYSDGIKIFKASKSKAAYMLHSDSVSEEDIERAQIFLNLFVKDFEHLYGLRFMSANLHSLLHLPDAVRKAGPLWVNSCFPLEDLNGKVARLIHATKSPEHQICESFFVQQ